MYVLAFLFLCLAMVVCALFFSRKILNEERELDRKVRETLKNEETSFIVAKMISLRKRSNLDEKRDRARYNLLKAQLKERVKDEKVLQILNSTVDHAIGFYRDGK